jgi:HrpA-like RNA helicase
VDEVHERQLDTDVLLGFLRKSLHVFPKLFVVLMSATMDSERFVRYWGSDTPHVHLPGRTFPVTDYMLEDVLDMTGYVPPPRMQRGGKAKGTRSSKQRKTSPWNDSEVSDDDEDDKVDSGEEITLEKGHRGDVASHTPLESLLERIDETNVDPELICCLVRHIVRNKTAKDEGSILVFLPGVQEIISTIETIRRGTKDLALVLLPLHGGLQPKEQSCVFQRAPNGYTKVVCATNVAETR